MKNFEQTFYRVDRFFFGLCSIETRGESAAKFSSVGDNGFWFGIGVLKVGQPVTEGITLTASTESIRVSEAIAWILPTNTQK